MLGTRAPTKGLCGDLDDTDEEWEDFIQRVREAGERELAAILQRQETGEVEPAPKIDPATLYYWHHLMGGGDE